MNPPLAENARKNVHCTPWRGSAAWAAETGERIRIQYEMGKMNSFQIFINAYSAGRTYFFILSSKQLNLRYGQP